MIPNLIPRCVISITQEGGRRSIKNVHSIIIHSLLVLVLVGEEEVHQEVHTASHLLSPARGDTHT